MKKKSLFALLCCSIIFLCSCTQAREIENQAYAVAMGIDNFGDGIEITVKFPSLSSGTKDESSSDVSQYKQLSAKDISFDIALEKLRRSSPRKLNLTHLELLVISKELALSENMRALIQNIFNTERLHASSNVLIFDGKAADFIKTLEPSIGSRLSIDIPAQLEHLSEQGLTANTTLAELFYLTESVYSDPIVARTANAEESQNKMLGTVVFSEGEFTLELDEKQSMLVNLLKQRVQYFKYEIDGKLIEAAPASPAKLGVDISQFPARLKVKLHLNIGSQGDFPNKEFIRGQIISDIRSVIQFAQQHGVDPFGFSEKAAKHFLTIQKWLEFDWQSVYAAAIPVIEVEISRWDA